MSDGPRWMLGLQDFLRVNGDEDEMDEESRCASGYHDGWGYLLDGMVWVSRFR